MKKMLALALVLLLVGCAARSKKYLVSGAVSVSYTHLTLPTTELV